MKSQDNLKRVLIEKINNSEWWHVVPRDPNSYEKRGQFLSSTFRDAEFYGRPIDISIKVNVSNPIFGFSETEILEQIFPDGHHQIDALLQEGREQNAIAYRFYADAIMAYEAQACGYDSIVLVCESGRKSLESNHKPRAIELNILYPFTIQKPRFEKLRR